MSEPQKEKLPTPLNVGDQIEVMDAKYEIVDTKKLDARSLMPLVGLKRVE